MALAILKALDGRPEKVPVPVQEMLPIAIPEVRKQSAIAA
jgi:hypothetical protein